jgi:glycosyltransferase involved in cell wall biosynthesis
MDNFENFENFIVLEMDKKKNEIREEFLQDSSKNDFEIIPTPTPPEKQILELNPSIRPKIIFLSIIRNESKIIRRCLDAIALFVDAFCICDTGSNDNTLDIINDYARTCEETGKPFHIANHTWNNFGHNRSLSFTECKNWVQNELQWDLHNTWCLLLDADMVFRVENIDNYRNIFMATTNADGYHIIQKNSSLTYWNTRFIRMSKNWTCQGVTHEYWDCPSMNILKVDQSIMWIHDVNDGGCKMDKYIRDANLLENGIKDPNTPPHLVPRYYFYLAQTYSTMTRYDKAIEYYNKRIEAGGWVEEIWYSHYQKYMITKSLEDLWAGIECFSKRLEAVYYYLSDKRKSGKKYLQQDFALGYIGYLEIMKKSDGECYLFMEKDVYDWKFLDEFALVCYYTDHKKEGKIATEILLEKRNKISKQDYERIQANYRFY